MSVLGKHFGSHFPGSSVGVDRMQHNFGENAKVGGRLTGKQNTDITAKVDDKSFRGSVFSCSPM